MVFLSFLCFLKRALRFCFFLRKATLLSKDSLSSCLPFRGLLYGAFYAFSLSAGLPFLAWSSNYNYNTQDEETKPLFFSPHTLFVRYSARCFEQGRKNLASNSTSAILEQNKGSVAFENLLSRLTSPHAKTQLAKLLFPYRLNGSHFLISKIKIMRDEEVPLIWLPNDYHENNLSLRRELKASFL